MSFSVLQQNVLIAMPCAYVFCVLEKIEDALANGRRAKFEVEF